MGKSSTLTNDTTTTTTKKLVSKRKKRAPQKTPTVALRYRAFRDGYVFGKKIAKELKVRVQNQTFNEFTQGLNAAAAVTKKELSKEFEHTLN